MNITKKKKKNKIGKRTKISAMLILIAIPLTILFGVFFLNDRKYYFISILILIYTMIPFFMILMIRFISFSLQKICL